MPTESDTVHTIH